MRFFKRLKVFPGNRIVVKTQEILLDDVPAVVVTKKIRHIHLRVCAPDGKVMISAPARMDLEAIRRFALSKLLWIKKHQQLLRGRKREPFLNYTSGESHLYLGKQYPLHLLGQPPYRKVFPHPDSLEIHVRGIVSPLKVRRALEAWYRSRLREICLEYISKWEPRLGVKVQELGIKQMKTKWGTCNISAHRIWISLALVKMSVDCIEYIVVHEMMHLVERKHNRHFKNRMDQHFPEWRHLREVLNRGPISCAKEKE